MAHGAYSVDFSPIANVGTGMREAATEQRQAAFQTEQMKGMEQQRAFNKQKMEAGEIELNKAKYEEKQTKEQQARDETYKPVSGYFKDIGIVDPDLQKHFLGQLAEGGFLKSQPDGEPAIKGGHLKPAMEYINTNKIMQSQAGKISIQFYSNQIKELETKLADPKFKGDPAEGKKLIKLLEDKKVQTNNEIMRNDEKINVTMNGVEAAVKGLGKDDNEVRSVLAKNPALSASAQFALKTGDATEFNKLLTEMQKEKAKTAEQKALEAGKDRRAKWQADARMYAANKGASKKNTLSFSDYFEAAKEKNPEITMEQAYDKFKGAGKGKAKLQLPGITPTGTGTEGAPSLTSKYLK